MGAELLANAARENPNVKVLTIRGEKMCVSCRLNTWLPTDQRRGRSRGPVAESGSFRHRWCKSPKACLAGRACSRAESYRNPR